jgi:hypothetical protein
VFQELRRDDGANGVAAAIIRSGVAAPVPIEPGERIGTARFEFAAEDVALCHALSIAHLDR